MLAVLGVICATAGPSRLAFAQSGAAPAPESGPASVTPASPEAPKSADRTDINKVNQSVPAVLAPQYNGPAQGVVEGVDGPIAVSGRQGGGGALGVHIGSFMIYPSLSTGVTYDDNVYRAAANRRADAVLRGGAAVAAQSDWSRHSVAVSLAVDGIKYVTNGQLDGFNAQLGALGRYDIDLSSALTGNVSFTRSISGIASATAQLATPLSGTVQNPTFSTPQPVTSNQYFAGLRYDKLFNRLLTRAVVSLTETTFVRAPGTAGTSGSVAYSDGSVLNASGRVGYVVTPLTNFFTEAAFNDRTFRNSALDSRGLRITAGISGELTRLIRGEIAIGGLRQTLNAPGANSVSGLAANAQLQWFPIEQLTLGAYFVRDIGSPSAVNQASGISTTSGVLADYEVHRNMLLSLNTSFTNFNYRPTAAVAGATDDLGSIAGGATYFFNRNLSGNVSYIWTKNMSSGSALNYNRNQVTVGIHAQF